MIETRTSKRPVFVPGDFKMRFSVPCALDEEMSNARHQVWYTGAGVAPASHPLVQHITFAGCGSCGSDDVLVIATQWCVSYNSGNAYWDYEIACDACGTFTQRSYSEND